MARKSRRKQGRVTQGRGWEVISSKSKSSAPSLNQSSAPSEQTIKVREERRGSKHVTVAQGFVLVDADLKVLGKKLKTHCGAGGTVQPWKGSKDLAVIEVQGQHRDTVREYLRNEGYRVP